jgi:hypothetical protein
LDPEEEPPASLGLDSALAADSGAEAGLTDSPLEAALAGLEAGAEFVPWVPVGRDVPAASAPNSRATGVGRLLGPSLVL